MDKSVGIFLSHSTRNKSATKKLTQALKKNFTVYYSEHDNQLGESWVKRLTDEMRQCAVVVIYLTKDWLKNKKWCRAEFYAALMAGKKIVVVNAMRGKDHDDPILPLLQDFRTTRRGKVDFDDIVTEISKLVPASSVSVWPGDRSPYPGMNALDIEDAPVFFGRDEVTQKLVDKVNRSIDLFETENLILMYGPSGAGKSSILRAGLVARLRKMPKRCEAKDPVFPDAFSAHVHQLESEGWFQEKRARNQPKLILSIDQFEEVFNLEGARYAEFEAALLQCLSTRDVLVTATMRSDFMPNLQQVDQLSGRWDGVSIDRVAQMDLSKIIELPANRAQFSVDENLIAALSRDAEHLDDALPLLAFTLQRIWRRANERNSKELSLQDYEALFSSGPENVNGLEAVLVQNARTAIDELDLDDDQYLLIRRAFIPHLVDLSETGAAIRRRAPRTSFQPETLDLLSRLAAPQWRLINSCSLPDGSPGFEVTHEALLRRWPLLSDIISDEAENLQSVRRAEIEATQWATAEDNTDDYLNLTGERLANILELRTNDLYRTRLEPISAYIAQCRKAQNERTREQSALRELALRRIDDQHLAHVTALNQQKRFHESLAYAERELRSLAPEAIPRSLGGICIAAAQTRSQAVQKLSNSTLTCFAEVSDGSRQFLADAKGQFYCLSANSPDVDLWDLNLGNGVPLCMAYLPCTGQALVGFDNGRLVSVDTIERIVSEPIEPMNSEIMCLQADEASRVLMIGARSGECLFLDVDNMIALEAGSRRHQDRVTGSIFLPQTNRFVSFSWDHSIGIWDLNAETKAKFVQHHSSIVCGVVAAPDERSILSWSLDGRCVISDLKGRAISQLPADKDAAAVVAATFGSSANKVFFARADGTVWRWHTSQSDGGALSEIDIGFDFANDQRIINLIASGDGRFLTIVTLDGRVMIVALSMRWLMHTQSVGAEIVRSYLSSDRTRIYILQADGHLSVFSPENLPLTHEFVPQIEDLPPSGNREELLEAVISLQKKQESSKVDGNSATSNHHVAWPIVRPLGQSKFIEASNSLIGIVDFNQQQGIKTRLPAKFGRVRDFGPAASADIVRVLTTTDDLLDLQSKTLELSQHAEADAFGSSVHLMPGSNRLLSVQMDGTWRLHEDLTDNEGDEIRSTTDPAKFLAVSADGAMFAAATIHNDVQFIRPSNQTEFTLNRRYNVTGKIQFAPSGGYFAFPVYKSNVVVFETARSKGEFRTSHIRLPDADLIRILSWAPNNRSLIAVHRDGACHIIRRRKTGWVAVPVQLEGRFFRHLAWTNDNRGFAITSEIGIEVFDAASLKRTSFVPDEDAIGVGPMGTDMPAIWRRGTRIAIDSDDGQAQFPITRAQPVSLDPKDGNNEADLYQFKIKKSRLRVSRKNGDVWQVNVKEPQRVHACSKTGLFIISKANNRTSIGKFRPHARGIRDIQATFETWCFDPKGDFIALLEGSALRIFDAVLGIEIYALDLPKRERIALGYSKVEDAFTMAFAPQDVLTIDLEPFRLRGDALLEEIGLNADFAAEDESAWIEHARFELISNTEQNDEKVHHG
nr:TIR domain-containing protein [Hyphomonas sp. Mor2]